MFYIHGAGWVFGDDKTHDRLFRELAVGADAAGVFPVYDRAPEKGYPTQVEQNYAVGQWVLTHGAQHGLDTSRIAVTGESVGGCMSAVFALMNKDRGGIDLKARSLAHGARSSDHGTSHGGPDYPHHSRESRRGRPVVSPVISRHGIRADNGHPAT